MHKLAFLEGYMFKEANSVSALDDALGVIFNKVLPETRDGFRHVLKNNKLDDLVGDDLTYDSIELYDLLKKYEKIDLPNSNNINVHALNTLDTIDPKLSQSAATNNQLTEVIENQNKTIKKHDKALSTANNNALKAKEQTAIAKEDTALAQLKTKVYGGGALALGGLAGTGIGLGVGLGTKSKKKELNLRR